MAKKKKKKCRCFDPCESVLAQQSCELKKNDNVDIFLQLKTHFQKIIMRLIYRSKVHNIICDRKSYNQITKLIDLKASFMEILTIQSLPGEIL